VSRVIEPEVRLVHSFELTSPPGLIGIRTEDFFELFVTVEVLWDVFFDSRSESLESSEELELSRETTLFSRLFSLSDRPTICEVSVIFWSLIITGEVFVGSRNQKIKPISANIGRSIMASLSIR